MERQSLKFKFSVVIVAIYAAIALVTLCAMYTSTNRIINDLALRFGTKEALLEKNKIISIIDREVVLAKKMADDSTLKKWARDESHPEYRKQAMEELESYRKLYRDKSFFIAFAGSKNYYVYNKNSAHGQIEKVPLDPAKSADTWFFDGLKTIDDYALNLDYNPTLQETKVWFNAIMQGDRGERIGICGGGITITDFLKEIDFSKEQGLSTILIDRSGVVQAHEDRTIVEHNATTRDPAKKITIFSMLDKPAEQERLRNGIDSLLTRKSEVQAFPASFGGKNYLVAVSYMEGLGWLNVVLVDVSRVVSMKVFLPIVVIMSLSLLLVVIAIGLLMNKMVLVPLTKLSHASRAVAEGNYDITLPVTGKDELGSLTGSFNTMTATILDYTNNLEGKVRERTDELTTTNRMLEESQQRIVESISYARMIQSSILPDRETLERCLGEHFVLYRPKEMVGGDFYFTREFTGHFLLAVIDCTGHGIPGAFMTMTVNSVLNHVVDVVCSDNPSRILSELNRVLRRTLHLRDVDAGLDIALCMVDRDAGRMVYAGAGLPVTLVSSGVVHEIRGDHQRVGYKGSRLDYTYTNHEIRLAAGDSCYLTSDGLLDEPGGEKGFGFGSERFRAFLAKQSQRAMHSRVEALEQVLTDYRKGRRQRDDITVIGFRI